MFLKLYVIGIVLGILSSIYFYFKTIEYCQKKKMPYNNKLFFDSATTTFRMIMLILTPIIGYILFFGMLIFNDDEIEEMLDDAIKDLNNGGDEK